MWTKQASIVNKRAFATLAFLPAENGDTQLFLIGGLDPITYTHVLAVEVYDKDIGAWKEYRDLPYSDSVLFPASPDSGCMAIHDGKVFTLGDDVSAFDWQTWELTWIGGTEGRGADKKCSLIKNENGEYGFFFLSADWFSLETLSWSKYSTPSSAFNIASFNAVSDSLKIWHQL